MKNRFLYFFYFLIATAFVISCTKDTIPGTIPGKWKLILQGNDNENHRIDTFALARPNDSVQEFLTFNTDYSSGVLELKGYGLDSGKYKYMDSIYTFSWIYFNEGPEIWINLKENPKKRFHVWTDSSNIHLHVNYQDNTYLCDYYPALQGNYPSIQEIFQKQ